MGVSTTERTERPERPERSERASPSGGGLVGGWLSNLLAVFSQGWVIPISSWVVGQFQSQVGWWVPSNLKLVVVENPQCIMFYEDDREKTWEVLFFVNGNGWI